MAESKFIKYGDRQFPLTDGMTLEQAKQVMARHFPELADPKIETKKNGSETIYVFTKKAGHKGATSPLARAIQNLDALKSHAIVPSEIVRWTAARDAPDIRSASLDGEELLATAQALEELFEHGQTIGQTLLDLPPAIEISGEIL